MSYSVERIIDHINDTNNPRSCVKDPCGFCNKTVKIDHQAIQCDSCELWVHISCNNTSLTEYEHLMHKNDLWYCLVYNIKNNLDRLPLTNVITLN